MLGIDISHITFNLYVVVHVFYFLIILLYWKKNTSIKPYYKKQYGLTLLFLLHMIFAFESGDFYSYYEMVTTNDYHAVETVYEKIGLFVNGNYLLFRIIIWGGAVVLFQLLVKKFKLDIYRTSFFLIAIFISVFDYARASFAMTIFYLGLSFVLIPSKTKILSLLFGFIVIFLSIYFHRSMIIATAVCLFMLFPINKKTILLFALLLLVSGSFISQVVNLLDSGDYFDEGINEKIEVYSSLEYFNYFSVYEWIRRYIEYATFFVPFIIITWKFYFAKTISIPLYIERLYKITFGLLLIAIGTLFTGHLTFALFYRILFMTIIPIVILFCYCENKKIISNKTYKFVLYLGIICVVFGFAKIVIGGNLW